MTKKKEIPWKRQVLCIEDGMVWDSILACSKSRAIPFSTLRQCVNRRGSVKGKHYVEASKEDVEQFRRSKEIKVGDKVHMRNDPNNPGIVESIDGDFVRFRFDSPIELCECMREQLVKVETN